MTERKFTDEQIIKALECCVNGTSEACLKCTFGLTPPYPVCKTMVEKYALDLINRQRAEIESLTQNNISTKYPNRVLCSLGVIFTKSLEDYDKLIGDISAEAIKEFAEKLKQKASTTFICNHKDGINEIIGYHFSPTTIDNLVKEMTESDI